MKRLKRTSAFLLVLALLVTMFPTTAFATASVTGNTINMSVNDTYTLSYDDSSKYKCIVEDSNIVVMNKFTIKAKKIGNTSIEVQEKIEYKFLGAVIWTKWQHKDDYKVSVNGDVTVTYDVNGGNAPTTPMVDTVSTSGMGQTYVIDTTKYSATRNASGTSKFMFVGWNTNKNATSGLASIELVAASKNNTGNVVLYAIWDEQKPTTINYVANKDGATVSIASDTTYSSVNGSSYAVDATKFYATKDMDDASTYVFLGWSENSNSNKVVTQVTLKPDTKTLYGVWEKVDNVALVQAYDQNNNSISEVQRYAVPADGTEVTIDQFAPAVAGKVLQRAEITENVLFGQTITRPLKRLSYERDWYTPGIWYYGQGAVIKSLKTWFYYHPETIIKCYYTDAPLGTFTITAAVNDLAAGTISNAGTTSVQEKSSATYTITPNEGFKIKDVLVDGQSVGAVASYKFDSVKGNHTITAIFEAITCLVTFAENGGNYQPVDQTVTYGGTLQVPDPMSKEGCDFGGWYTDQGLTQEFNFEAPIKTNLTLFAKWNDKMFTVSFNSTGGSEVTAQAIKYNGFVQEPIKPIREGYTFIGWQSKNVDGYYTFGNFPVTEDDVLYAAWTEDMKLNAPNVEVTYDGEPHGITIEGLPEGAEPSFGNSGNEYINAGKYAVEFTVYADGYTTTTGSAILTIKPAPLTITADSASKTYDGGALTDNGWQDTTPAGIVGDDVVLYVAVTGSAINAGTEPNVPSQAIIGKLNMPPPPPALLTSMATSRIVSPRVVPTDEQLATIRSNLANAIASYNPNNNELSLQDVINQAIGPFYADATANYNIEYVSGKLTITSSGGGHHRTTTTTTITEPEVPLAGTPELNKVDHFNYMNGYQDGTIKPLNNITREEVASIFYRMLTDDSRKIFDTQNQDFSDINADRWSVGAIATLANAGIITGNSDGTFAATKPITRAEFAVVASRFDTLEENTDGITFSDISGNWAEKYIKSAVKKGWITGYSDGTFKPNQYITRAEAMALINRVLDRRVEATGLVDGYKTFSDVKPTDWYYYQVIEATNNHDYAQRNSMSDTEIWTKIKEDKTWTK